MSKGMLWCLIAMLSVMYFGTQYNSHRMMKVADDCLDGYSECAVLLSKQVLGRFNTECSSDTAFAKSQVNQITEGSSDDTGTADFTIEFSEPVDCACENGHTWKGESWGGCGFTLSLNGLDTKSLCPIEAVEFLEANIGEAWAVEK